jgi:2,4-dienoyl-CoA reductase [(3E)-enoyl-CoA-producing], peroxisomal
VTPGTPYQAHVSAAKAGIDALSAVLAVEEGPHGVRSNVISPGAIGGTEGADRLSPKGQEGDKRTRERTPLGRIGHLYDVENATIFLFSDASAFVTGQVIAVDGGSSNFGFNAVPYPQSVLDPESVKSIIKAKM